MSNETFFLFDFGTSSNDQKEEMTLPSYDFNNCNYRESIFQTEAELNFQSASYSFFNSSDEETEYNGDVVGKPNQTNQGVNVQYQVPMSLDIYRNDDEMLEISSTKKSSDKETREKKFWTKIEDDLLLGYIDKMQSKNWRQISDYIKSKSPQQCAYRYSKLLSDMNKKKWNRKDDIKLIELVESFGQNWEIISRNFGDRSERDVETRFKEKLDPNVKNTKFTEEEDNEIIRLYEEYGNDWFQIARRFKNRNAKMIKKRFQSYLKFHCKKKSRGKKSFSSFHNLPTRSHSQVSTPRSSQGPSSIASVSEFKNETNFNVENFFHREELDFDIFNAQHLKIDMLASYSSQIENIDKYFSQICLFYTEKSLRLEQAIARSNRSGFEIDNILNINSQVSSQIESFMNQVRQMQREKTLTFMTEQAYKLYIVRYIETILQIIQQIKVKVSLFQSL